MSASWITQYGVANSLNHGSDTAPDHGAGLADEVAGHVGEVLPDDGGNQGEDLVVLGVVC